MHPFLSLVLALLRMSGPVVGCSIDPTPEGVYVWPGVQGATSPGRAGHLLDTRHRPSVSSGTMSDRRAPHHAASAGLTRLAISLPFSRSTTAMSYWLCRSSQNCGRLPK